MLEVRNLEKRYSGIPVVHGVSFTIKPGEILGYLGPNGAGWEMYSHHAATGFRGSSAALPCCSP